MCLLFVLLATHSAAAAGSDVQTLEWAPSASAYPRGAHIAAAASATHGGVTVVAKVAIPISTGAAVDDGAGSALLCGDAAALGADWRSVVFESDTNPGRPSYCPEHNGTESDSGWIHSCWSVGTDRDTGEPLTLMQKLLARVMMPAHNRACGFKLVLDHEVTLQKFTMPGAGQTCMFCWDSNQS